MSGLRPTWVEVDLAAIRHNVRVLKPRARGAHGGGEGQRLRSRRRRGRAGRARSRRHVDRRRARRGRAPAPRRRDRRAHPGPVGVPARLRGRRRSPPGSRPASTSEAALERSAAAAAGRDVGVHVKVDTGMHRVGVYPPEATRAFVDRVAPPGCVWRRCGRTSPAPRRMRRPRCVQLELFLAVVEDVRAGGAQTGVAPRGEQRRHHPVPGDPPRPRPARDRDLRPRARPRRRRRPGAAPGAHVALERSHRPSGCPPGSASRTGTATGSSATRTSPRCRSATPTATLACCRPGPRS